MSLSPGFVSEVHADFLQHMAWDLPKVHLATGILGTIFSQNPILAQTSLVSFSANCPGPDSIALMVPVRKKLSYTFHDTAA